MSKETRLASLVQESFFKKIQEKTSWGRNEIMNMYRDSMNEALILVLSEEQKEKK